MPLPTLWQKPTHHPLTCTVNAASYRVLRTVSSWNRVTWVMFSPSTFVGDRWALKESPSYHHFDDWRQCLLRRTVVQSCVPSRRNGRGVSQRHRSSRCVGERRDLKDFCARFSASCQKVATLIEKNSAYKQELTQPSSFKGYLSKEKRLRNFHPVFTGRFGEKYT